MGKKSTLRKIHINQEEWKWIVEAGNFGEVKEVRIYSPQKTMFRINPELLSDERMYVGIEGFYPTKIVPSRVKQYILDNLIKKTQTQ